MEPVTKTGLRKKIAEIETKIEIEAMVRNKIEEFKHYKQVNKRFIDAIKAIDGYHAWMIKDYSHKISVSKSTGPYQNVAIEIYVYGEELNWEKLLHKLDRFNYAESLEKYKENLKQLDSDIEKLKEIRKSLDSYTMSNFSIYSLKSDLDHAIRDSGE